MFMRPFTCWTTKELVTQQHLAFVYSGKSTQKPDVIGCFSRRAHLFAPFLKECSKLSFRQRNLVASVSNLRDSA